MLIIAYDKKSFIDFSRYGRVMISTDGLAVCVLSEENKPWVVGRYNSTDVSQKVLENIADNVLKGTVKNHTEYKGIKQTELTICSIK